MTVYGSLACRSQHCFGFQHFSKLVPVLSQLCPLGCSFFRSTLCMYIYTYIYVYLLIEVAYGKVPLQAHREGRMQRQGELKVLIHYVASRLAANDCGRRMNIEGK